MYNQQDIKHVAELLTPAARMGVISDSGSIISTLEQALIAPPEPLYNEYMTKTEVMEFFGLHYQTYYSWIRKGWLKPYGMGRKVCFLRSEVIKVRKRGDSK